MSKLSVIIVNTNTRDLVCQCLSSLTNNPPRRQFEVIVVDNASTDGSCDAIESKYPFVQIIRNAQNLGFCVANNRGLAVAKSQYILLLNSDTIVTPGSLDRMCEVADANEHVGIVAPKLVYLDGSLQMSYGPIPNLFGVFCSFFEIKRFFTPRALRLLGRSHWSRIFGKTIRDYVSWSSGNEPATRILTPNLLATGACLLIRRQCIEQVGLLDPNIFMYCDDADYCQRVHDHGWKILYLAEATIVHIKGGTVGQRYRWTSARAYESMLYFFRKHRGWTAFQVARAFALLSLLLRGIINSMRRHENTSSSWTLFRQVARASGLPHR
jgi:GT2 family glycosyltransferase